MVIKKCFKCQKNITKKSPGLECSRCEKVVHANSACVKLSNKQLNTLRDSPGIEWSCDDCMRNLSRRSSFMIPEDDNDDNNSDTGTIINYQSIDTRKLVQDISREIKKTFREEISNLESSLEFLSDQFSTMEQAIKSQDIKIQELERKNQDLNNRNSNLELRMTVLEQGFQQTEQKSLLSSIEIAGLPDMSPQNVGQLLNTIATELDVNKKDVQSFQRLSGTKEKPGPIRVEMKTKEARNQWVEAGKSKRLTAGALFPSIQKEKSENKIFVREALTKQTKSILYHAKVQLKKSFQFVWCKDGKIFARKTGNSKIFMIRSQYDINKLEAHNKESTLN